LKTGNTNDEMTQNENLREKPMPKNSGRPAGMGFKLIIAGFIFLFNPWFSVYDVLPDVIGWSLIYGGMLKLRDMAPALEDAMTQLRRLIWLTSAQTAVMLLLPLMTDTAYALTFTSVFAIAGAWLTILFINRFGDGMEYIAMREGSNTPLSELANFRMLTIVFTAAKAALTLLPELSYLSVTDYEGYITAIEQFDIANYRTLLYLLNIIGVTIFGLIWLNIALRYINGLRRDGELCASLERYYRENVLTQADMLFCRSLRCALILFGAAFCFQLDIVIDGICLTPDFVAAILFFLGASVLLKRYPAMSKVRMISVFYLAAGIVTFAVMLVICLNFYSYGITKSITGFYTFIVFLVLAAVTAALFCLILRNMLRLVADLIEHHTGEELTDEFVRMKERIDNMRRDLRRQLLAFVITGLLSAFSSVLRYVLMYAFEEYWMIDTVIQAVWIWNAVGMMMNIWQKVAEKYGIRRRNSNSEY